MFFEEWQRWITDDDPSSESRSDHFYRMNFLRIIYDSIFITKFEKNYGGYCRYIGVYQFMRAFSKNVSSVPVAYNLIRIYKSNRGVCL